MPIVETSLLKVAFQIEKLITNQNKWFEPYLVISTSTETNFAKVLVKEFKVTQKSLVSFRIQVPLKQADNNQSQDNIFKSSRLMLHEIIDSNDEKKEN